MSTRYGCIGKPLGHSFSKEIHAQFASYDYQLWELDKSKLAAFLTKRDFSGINVTIPYKQAVLPFLDGVSPASQRIGAVNTIVNRDGRLFGYNTDYSGMTALLRRKGVDLCGKRVLILGTGGTSKTAMAVAHDCGANEILRVSRTAKENAISYEAAYETDPDIIINTTPVGMFPNASETPINISHFPHLSGVLDAVYNPLRTGLVLDARAKSVPAAGGLFMLVVQAAAACGIFLDRAISDDEIGRVYKQVLSEKENIVLIGMPGSGKSTVAALLGEKLRRPVLDTDAEIVRRIGMPIADYFAKHGEAAFRQVEKDIIRDSAALNGHIIATGGGAVLDFNNIRHLKQNGRLYFLDRPLVALCPSADRPLADSRAALEALYAARKPIYETTADCRVPSVGSAEEAARVIASLHEKRG